MRISAILVLLSFILLACNGGQSSNSSNPVMPISSSSQNLVSSVAASSSSSGVVSPGSSSAASSSSSSGMVDVAYTLEVARWKNDATGAYSMIHDDLCSYFNDGIFNVAGPLAQSYGVVFGAGAISGTCLERGGDIWARMQTLRDQGHEIISHSWDHGAAVDLGWTPLDWDVQSDVIDSKRVLEENIPGLQVDYFIFPYDAYDDNRLNELRENGYLGARAGPAMYSDRRVNTYFESFDPFRCEFDAYMSKPEQDTAFANGSQFATSIYNDENDDVDIQHAQAAIDMKGWSMQEFHAVSNTIPTGWGAITEANYERLLAFLQVKQNENALWVDTPTNITKYVMTKSYLRGMDLSGGEIIFDLVDDADRRYDTMLTIKLTLAAKLNNVSQNGENINFRELSAGEYLIDASPFGGNLSLSYHADGTVILGAGQGPVVTDDCGTPWLKANLTHYESYPEPGSEECIVYNGCMWAGMFAGLDGVQPESWVMANNIASVHSKDWEALRGKTLKLRQGELMIDVVVYDNCTDSDCDGCCTANLGGDGYLIDVEKYTRQRFGSGAGIVEWQVCN